MTKLSRFPYCSGYGHPIPFNKFVEIYGYESLWEFDNMIPDYVKQEILDHFLFRYLGTYNEQKFRLWWKHQIQLKERKFMKLLESEFIQFDPLVQTYTFTEYNSENHVDRSGKNEGETIGGGGGTVTATTEQDTTGHGTTINDLETATTYGSRTSGTNESTSKTSDDSENMQKSRGRNIDSAYPESNVSGTTSGPLDTIDWKYASTSGDTAGSVESSTSGESSTNGTSNSNISRTGTDRTDNTSTVTNDTTGKVTGTNTTTNSTTTDITNKQRTTDRTVGRNKNTTEQQGRGVLPQLALSQYRDFVRGSNALEWLLNEMEPLFYGFFEETEEIRWRDLV